MNSTPSIIEALKAGRYPVMAITDRKLAGGVPALIKRCELLLAEGLPVLMLREKDLMEGVLVTLAEELALRCRASGALFIVNGSVEVADEVGANGVQLGYGAMSIRDVRRAHPSASYLIGSSCHSKADLLSAHGSGASYALLSPFAQPISKLAAGEPLGVDGFRAMVEGAMLPVYALGGITTDNAAAAISAGACGVAAIGLFFGADWRPGTLSELLRLVDKEKTREPHHPRERG